MSIHILSSRSLATTLMLLAGLVGLSGRLSAQEATSNAAISSAPSNTSPAVEAVSVPAPSTEAGPRISPPLERYQGTLPKTSGSESAAMSSEGGRHTIVISTLALVLIAVIVVLLVAD